MKGDELFVILISVLFIGLKLGGVITWSWIWVLAPLWIPIPIYIILFILAFIMVIVNRLLR